MITVQSIDMSGFNAGLAGLARLGIPMAKVIRKETGEMIKTLVKVSPPKEVSRSKYKAETEVRSKFAWAATGGDRTFEGTGATTSKSGIKWYSVNEQFLRGVATELDARNSSEIDLYRRFRKLTKKGRTILPFKHPRRRQRVMLSQKLLVKKSQVTGIVRRVLSKFGRLKAGWMASVRDGKIKLSAGNSPAAWVLKHVNSGLRGGYEDGTNNQTHPQFTIINRAHGVSQKSAAFFYKKAVAIRAKAMLANILTYTKGKKNLADYARA